MHCGGATRGIANIRSFSMAFVVILLLDIVIEQLFVRTQVYAFPRTWDALTVFAGTQYQFPVYESVFVAAYAAGFTYLRMSAHDSPDGLPGCIAEFNAGHHDCGRRSSCCRSWGGSARYGRP